MFTAASIEFFYCVLHCFHFFVESSLKLYLCVAIVYVKRCIPFYRNFIFFVLTEEIVESPVFF